MWRPRAPDGDEKWVRKVEEPASISGAVAGRATSGLRGVKGVKAADARAGAGADAGTGTVDGAGPDPEWRRWDMGKDTCCVVVGGGAGKQSSMLLLLLMLAELYIVDSTVLVLTGDVVLLASS